MSKMIDIGTTIAILALALALIPLPDVLIGWFCRFFPAVRSPATRMGDLHDSLHSTHGLLLRNFPDWNSEDNTREKTLGWRKQWDEYVSLSRPFY